MTGDVDDMTARLRLLLPPWFPNQGSAPVVDAVITGIATLLAGVYALITFVYAQSRISSAVGVFLDLAAWDYFADRLLRNAGELDDSFRARVKEELIRPRLTRAAIRTALEEITSNPVRIIEPARLSDVGVWKMRGSGTPVSYWRVDSPGAPHRWSSRGQRTRFFVECTVPPVKTFGNNAMPAWGKYTLNWMLRGTAGARATGSSFIKRGGATAVSGKELVYSTINAMRALGVTAWVKFVPASTGPYWDQPGATWDGGASYDQPGQGPVWPN